MSGREWFVNHLVNIILLLLIVYLAWAFHHDVAALSARARDPCGYCSLVSPTGCNPSGVNLSALNISNLSGVVPVGVG